MKNKEAQRENLIEQITDMVEEAQGVVFHDMKTLDGDDITFMKLPGTIQIFIEHPYSRLGEEREVSWKYLTMEMLEEIVEIINERDKK